MFCYSFIVSQSGIDKIWTIIRHPNLHRFPPEWCRMGRETPLTHPFQIENH